MATLYSKIKFDRDDCAKLRDALLDSKVKSKIEEEISELEPEWRKVAEMFFEELLGATSITVETDNTDFLEAYRTAR